MIGNENRTVGTSVTFWSSRWAKHNSLSKGASPRTFKGFALYPAAPDCGQNWKTDPENSSPPPRGPLPTFIKVVVTSKATTSGSMISGNTVHVVIVKTDPGYQPNPGHAGTGKVVSRVC